MHVQEPVRCEQTIARVVAVMEAYKLDTLHPNVAAQFYFQAAVVYGMQGKQEQALSMLGRFTDCVLSLLTDEKSGLSGDDYFDRIDTWVEQTTLGDMMPRDRSFIVANALQALAHPAFAGMKDTPEYRKLMARIESPSNLERGSE